MSRREDDRLGKNVALAQIALRETQLDELDVEGVRTFGIR